MDGKGYSVVEELFAPKGRYTDIFIYRKTDVKIVLTNLICQGNKFREGLLKSRPIQRDINIYETL